MSHCITLSGLNWRRMRQVSPRSQSRKPFSYGPNRKRWFSYKRVGQEQEGKMRVWKGGRKDSEPEHPVISPTPRIPRTTEGQFPFTHRSPHPLSHTVSASLHLGSSGNCLSSSRVKGCQFPGSTHLALTRALGSPALLSPQNHPDP